MMLGGFAGMRNEWYSLGESALLPCPACGQDVHFPLFKTSGELTVWGLGILDTAPVYFTACPRCGAAFTIKPAVGRSRERWPDFPVHPEHLVPAQPSVK